MPPVAVPAPVVDAHETLPPTQPAPAAQAVARRHHERAKRTIEGATMADGWTPERSTRQSLRWVRLTDASNSPRRKCRPLAGLTLRRPARKTLFRWLHGGYMNPRNNKAQACGLG